MYDEVRVVVVEVPRVGEAIRLRICPRLGRATRLPTLGLEVADILR